MNEYVQVFISVLILDFEPRSFTSYFGEDMFQIFFGIWFICSLALPLVECIQNKVYEYKCCMHVYLILLT